MIVSIASGKGGTGKTTVSTSLALAIGSNVQLVDCDVEEPNAHIFLNPEMESIVPAIVSVPEIDESECAFCGKCRDVCAYNAIAVIGGAAGKKGRTLVFPELCHGCGACMFLCPRSAIREVSREIGVIEAGRRDGVTFLHGKLNIGEAMSPPLIRAVKRAVDVGKTVIIDAPPGTTCPVITSISGSDYCVLVTEPTPFGLNDLVLAVEVLRKMNIPFGVVINRADLGDQITRQYCCDEKIPILMEIPFDKKIAVSYSKGITIVEDYPEYRGKFATMLDAIKESVENEADSCHKR